MLFANSSHRIKNSCIRTANIAVQPKFVKFQARNSLYAGQNSSNIARKSSQLYGIDEL